MAASASAASRLSSGETRARTTVSVGSAEWADITASMGSDPLIVATNGHKFNPQRCVSAVSLFSGHQPPMLLIVISTLDDRVPPARLTGPARPVRGPLPCHRSRPLGAQ